MRGRLRVAGCLLAAATVLVSGCGSTKKSSTSTTGNNAGATSANAGATGAVRPQTVPQRTSSKESHHAGASKAAEAKPELTGAEILRKQKAHERAAARPTLEIAEADLPLKRRYPKDLQGKFMLACKAAKGSASSCECIIIRQEANLKVERGQSLAELLAVEIAFERQHASLADIRRRRVPSPRIIRRVVRECSNEVRKPRRASK